MSKVPYTSNQISCRMNPPVPNCRLDVTNREVVGFVSRPECAQGVPNLQRATLLEDSDLSLSNPQVDAQLHSRLKASSIAVANRRSAEGRRNTDLLVVKIVVTSNLKNMVSD